MLVFANSFKYCFEIKEKTKNFRNRLEFDLLAKEIQEQFRFYRDLQCYSICSYVLDCLL